MPEIQDWQNKALSSVYPMVFVDAIHYPVKDNGIIREMAAYVILGINRDGIKEVLGIYIGENESAKYWLNLFNELKNRGLRDILIICADGLTGMKEAVVTELPKDECQRSVSPDSQALMKALYLATLEVTKKWTMPIRNWGRVYGELSIMYEDRLEY